MKVGDTLDAIKEMIKTILLAIDKKIATAKFDRTVRGRIIEIINDRKYKVEIDGQTHNVKGKTGYLVNDVVYITIPQNNVKDMFIVF